KAAPPAHMVEDSFKHHYDPSMKKSPFKEKAYTISGTLLPPDAVKIISARMPTSQILKLAKDKGTTITAYLSALMIVSIYKGLVPKRAMSKTIGVNVPVDLRGHFTSETARNFFSVVEVGYNFQSGPADFDTVLASVTNQLRQKTTPEMLALRMNYNMAVQRNIFTGITPLFLKNLVLRAAYHQSETGTTCALSNMGRITMPEPFAGYIHSFHCLLNPTPIHRLKATVTSFREQFIINFTSCIEETKAQRLFLTYLAYHGVDITITCNGEEAETVETL
ncbi:hypothetical protein LJC63_13180, partial [Ruminococcaceae bacterium OttesenSCG-928-L11]|nr:hypothetical protein [Ruminococcaceae bacterium OttesenSCG-928-L11]